VWCDKTVVLGGFLALSGRVISAATLVDAVSLLDAVVWFDQIVVDSSLEMEWPAQIADAIAQRPLGADEMSQLREALINTWNQRGVDSVCQNFWRSLFCDPGFKLILSAADMAVDSARDPAEFLRSAESADWGDLLLLKPASEDRRLELAAFSTARALSGDLIAAQLGLFHMPSAIRRGLLASYGAPCQVTDVIAIEPIDDARLPSAFGRITEVAIKRGCDVWDAVATVRHELEPVRRSLRGSITDPSRIRMEVARSELGFGRPEAQVGFGFNFAVLSGFFGRPVRSRQIQIVQRLAQAADTLVQAADDLCRLARLEVPVINPGLIELSQIAQHLAG
jgi:hypothetical protein